MRASVAASPSPRLARRPGSALARILALLLLSSGTGACNRPAADEPAPAAAPVAAADQPLPAPAPPARVRGRKVLAEVTSPYSKIRVQQSGTRRTLGFIRKRGDEYVQTIVDLADPDVPAHPYIEAMAAPFMLVDDPRRLLVVGLGGGTLVRYLHARVPAAHIDAVEIDPEVVRLAAEWFGVVPGPRLQIVTDDAVRFIAGEGESYDVIWLDAFLDPGAPGTDNAGVPEELRGLGFLRRVEARLKPGGVAAFNIHHLTGYDAHVNAIAEVFPHVQVVRRSGTNEWIVLASTADAAPTPEALRSRAAALDALGTWKISFTELAEATSAWERRPSL
ncbi:spermidine synthase [Nannocystis exedens]|uniref:Spermidine synthase n=1 Tax=Nannocystis exedens TaxID=54 RepID=A0A1I1ZX61_9BACT|nr:fused MFS/spermidine synthase [Nannocystis exedens]PCC75317.1 Spermidine synthase [Nannocystis exedens]SFE35110.1 spermidine synthase [Nannocystis exedens]